MLKCLGAVCILISGSGFGWYLGRQEEYYYQQGVDLKRMLELLQGEIRYYYTPLPDAFTQILPRTRKEYRPFLLFMSKQLTAHEETSFSSIWAKGIEKHLQPLLHWKGLINLILPMGTSMGYLDQSMQQQTMAMTIGQIEEWLIQCKEKKEKRIKLEKSLGVILSMLLVIVLI